MIMRPASRAPAPVVWVRWVADGVCNEVAGTTRAARRATDAEPATEIFRCIGRSACCLTASCISTFGAPIKAPGAGGARLYAAPSLGRRGELVTFGVRVMALSRSGESAGPARSATGFAPLGTGRRATVARNRVTVRKRRTGSGGADVPWNVSSAGTRFYLLPL